MFVYSFVCLFFDRMESCVVVDWGGGASYLRSPVLLCFSVLFPSRSCEKHEPFLFCFCLNGSVSKALFFFFF